VNQIIKGRKEITPETARGLAAAFGTSAELWLNLENAFRLAAVRANDAAVSQRSRLHSVVPLAELLKRGWIKSRAALDDMEIEVCRFLEIDRLNERPKFRLKARRSGPYGELSPVQTAWAFRAKHLAMAADVPAFDRRRFGALLPGLCRLSAEHDGMRKAIRELQDAGVRVVRVPHLPGSKIDGAMFWLSKTAPVVALSLRHDRIDSFWFTLMHELAHVWQARPERGILDNCLVDEDALEGQERPKYETEADELASGWLLPRDRLRAFIGATKPYYSAERVTAFAQQIGVHPALVVGRMQHLGEIDWKNLRSLLGKASDQLGLG
jgi:HTH-type transcriptional regulator/antitoxin HigA